jgi:hypothetical protein
VLNALASLAFELSSDIPVSQVDAQLVKLRKIGQDARHAGCADVHNSVRKLMKEMEEERRLFEEAVSLAKQSERQAKSRERQLEQTLVQITEAWQEAEKRARVREERIRETNQALAEMCTESDAALQQVELDFMRAQQKVGNSEVQINAFEKRAVAMISSFESLQTPRARLNAFSLKFLSSYPTKAATTMSASSMSTADTGLAGEPSQDQIKEQLREIFGEQAHRLRNALQSHQTFSNEVKKVMKNIKDYSKELERRSDGNTPTFCEFTEVNGLVHIATGTKIAKEKCKSKRKKNFETRAAYNVVDMIDGWKEAQTCNGTPPFWYNATKHKVAFSPSEIELHSQTLPGRQAEEVGGTDLNTMIDWDDVTQTCVQAEAAHSVATGRLRDKMCKDSITCNGENIPARRAQFGRHVTISGEACIANPFLADSALINKDRIRGRIAIIGRGINQFTEKAKIAADAGAIGIVFVNTKKRLFDAIGYANNITIPVVAVANLAM